MLIGYEQHHVHSIVGLGKNQRLTRLSQAWIGQARSRYETEEQKQRLFAKLQNKVGTWKCKYRLIHKAEHMSQGSHPRYVVSILTGGPQHHSEKVFGACGELENRIKEPQLDLFADRTNCSLWWPNQFRLLLLTLAYTLVNAIRSIALQHTDLAHATCATIRLKLFKIGSVVIRNTRRIRLLLSCHYP